jgi:crotonobetainyl-CoA:carnitine CoA-transferase CaiB-like acyl-CoA transferase
MDTIAAGTLSGLLEQLGIGEGHSGGTTRIVGRDPIVASRYRLGLASAAALAAQGTAIAAVWRMRSGRGQDVMVDVRRAAIPGLRTIHCIAQNGYGPVVRGAHVRRNTLSPYFFRSRDDRYLVLDRVHTEAYHKLLELLQCSTAPQAMREAVGRWDAQELEDALAQRNLTGTIIRSGQEWLAHPQGKLLASRPPVEIEKIGESAPERLGTAARPLSGIRVIDMTHRLAGPVVSRTLAEQGADVLHISPPYETDVLSVVLDSGLGKRSAFVDLNRSGDPERLRQLAREADIFVQSWSPGSLSRRGLSARDVAALRPGIVYVSVSCFGVDGPWGTRGGYDTDAQAASGICIGEGSAECPQMVPTGFLNDYLAAYLGAAGAIAALIRRAREGGSYHVKVALTRASMWVLEIGELPDSQCKLDMPLPEPAESDFASMPDTVYGEVRFAAPITEYSKTKASWDKPPAPPGAHRLEWLAR